MKSSYSTISKFGNHQKSSISNPLTYCVGDNRLASNFLHGSTSVTLGPESKNCQLFMSQYCSEKWDGFCEVVSNNRELSYYPNELSRNSVQVPLSKGDYLVVNTAKNKYLVNMINGTKKSEPFDPNVAASPYISYWDSEQTMVPIYKVNPKTIDNDIVMDKILENPKIAYELLLNIYNNMKRDKTLQQLKNTKLGNFYESETYFKNKGGLN